LKYSHTNFQLKISSSLIPIKIPIPVNFHQIVYEQWKETHGIDKVGT